MPPLSRFDSTLPLARAVIATGACACLAADVSAQADVVLDPVVVTATRNAERSFDVPASVDAIDARQIRDGQPMIDLTETLPRIPGIVARNRQNYAQDLQISSRGFGARATFGVRGLRLFQDDIPQTMPDGQGQTGSFQLLSTERIEVLRGPFATQYGNAAGGVIAVFTERGSARPELTGVLSGGSFDQWNVGGKLTGTQGPVGYVLAANRFETDGYRDHSAAERTLGVAKLAMKLGNATDVTVLGTLQDQPDSQDPLGLTPDQWAENPRQADPVATLFDTRKSVEQQQVGATLVHRFDGSTELRATGYGGKRKVLQHLAFTGAAPMSSGGVVDLDRDYAGGSVKLSHAGTVAGAPFTLLVGADYERQEERRRGFVNDFGEPGDLRRDEDDTVWSADAYAQLELQPMPKLALRFGVRYSEVHFRVEDNYVTAASPDDSGSVKHDHVNPVFGVTFHVNPALNVYAAYGRGFETPTFAELAYRTGGTGVNFALEPSTSDAYEIGLKFRTSNQRLNVAVFAIDTDDEIIVDTAIGGRTTFKNAGKTRRRGVELGYDVRFGEGLSAHVALAYLDAEFARDVTTGSPPVTIPAGNTLPGVPERTAYAELSYAPPQLPGFRAVAEAIYVSSVFANDRNTVRAPSYAVMNVWLGQEWRQRDLRLSAFARANNVFDRKYVGSVIVNEGNGRFFESAPAFNWLAGLNATYAF
jgi:iron complex outermembrane receptor protein